MAFIRLKSKVALSLLIQFLPFWIFIGFYKFAATLHYSVIPALGEPLMPLWIVGLLLGGESFLQMVLDVPAGYLVDRLGRKRMLGIGLFGMAAAGFLLTRFSPVTYVISIAVSVVGWLFLAPGVNAYVLSHAKKETSGRFIALRDTFHSIGVVLASVSLPFVLLYTPATIGIILIILVGIAAIFLIISPRDQVVVHGTNTLPAEPYHIRRTSIRKTLRAVTRLNPASGMLCAYSLAGAIFYGAIWFVVPLAIANDPSQQILGLGLGIFDLSIVILGVIIGSIVDRGNKRLLVFFGLLIFAIMGVAVGLTLGPLFLLFGFLATAGDETTGLSLWSWLHSLDKEHAHDGAVAGVISLSEDLGYAIGPAFAGFVFILIGPAWTITFAAFPLVIALIAYVMVIRPHFATISDALAQIPSMPRRRRHKS